MSSKWTICTKKSEIFFTAVEHGNVSSTTAGKFVRNIFISRSIFWNLSADVPVSPVRGKILHWYFESRNDVAQYIFLPPSREYQWFWIFPPDEDIFPASVPFFSNRAHLKHPTLQVLRWSAPPLHLRWLAGKVWYIFSPFTRWNYYFIFQLTDEVPAHLKYPPQLYLHWPASPLYLRWPLDKVYFFRRISLTFEIPTPYLRNLLIFFWLFSVEVPAHLKYPFPSCISGGPLPSCISAGSRPTRFDIYFFLLPNGNYYFPLNYLYIWKYPPQYLRWPALRWPAPHFFILPFYPSFYRNLLDA